MRLGAKIIEIFSWFFGSMLILRFILRALGASETAPFVSWLYVSTTSLMEPFLGIFPSPNFGGTSVIDLSAVFAIIVYIGAGYFIAALLENLDNNLRFPELRKPKQSKKPQTPVIDPKEGPSGSSNQNNSQDLR